MILDFSLKLMFAKGKLLCSFSLYKRYRAMSTAPLDVLWYKLINVADVSWHPLFSKTNLPLGLMAKPGLIYQAVTRLTPESACSLLSNAKLVVLVFLRLDPTSTSASSKTWRLEMLGKRSLSKLGII